MKYPTLIIIALIFAITTCKKDNQTRKTTCVQPENYEYLDNYKINSMCSGDLCTEYLTIWKELFKEKNNLSQDFFDTYIELCNSEINSWADGISFRICYKFKID